VGRVAIGRKRIHQKQDRPRLRARPIDGVAVGKPSLNLRHTSGTRMPKPCLKVWEKQSKEKENQSEKELIGAP
jgi:hypothetical protein